MTQYSSRLVDHTIPQWGRIHTIETKNEGSGERELDVEEEGASEGVRRATPRSDECKGPGRFFRELAFLFWFENAIFQFFWFLKLSRMKPSHCRPSSFMKSGLQHS